MHQDNSNKLNLERNLRQSRRHNKDVPEWKSYEADEDDTRPIADPKLEWEADKSGMIHLRKHRGETEFLPGYGTENFGVSAYEKKPLVNFKKLGLFAGVTASGYLFWSNRQRLVTSLETLATYALLLAESFDVEEVKEA